jgi:hypothetical protein
LLAIVWLNALGSIVTARTAFWYRFRLWARPHKLQADKLLAPGEMERVGDAESGEWENLHLLLLFDYLLHKCLRPPA